MEGEAPGPAAPARPPPLLAADVMDAVWGTDGVRARGEETGATGAGREGGLRDGADRGEEEEAGEAATASLLYALLNVLIRRKDGRREGGGRLGQRVLGPDEGNTPEYSWAIFELRRSPMSNLFSSAALAQVCPPPPSLSYTHILL